MRKYLETAIKWLIYATFFVPLIVLPHSFIFPFIVPKILTFRSLTVLVIVLYCLLLAINWQRYKPRNSPLVFAVLLFLLSFAISTFFGVDAYHSFWDNHERMLGLFTIIHFVAYFIVCSQIFHSWDEWRRALKFFLVAGSIVMLVGLYQIYDPYALLNQGSERVISTLGNAIYVGGYGLFLVFVAALLFLEEKNKYWQIGEGLAALLGILGMLFSGTRGAMLGFAVGAAVAMIGYVFVLKEYPKVRRTLIIVLISGMVLVGVAYANRQSEVVQNIPALHRILNTSITELTSGSRIIAWKVGIESWRDLPVFGWGPNNFFYAFNAHYNPRSLEFGYGETWFDNAHNIVVNTLAVQGVFGLVTYLGVFVVGIYVLIVAYRQKRISRHLLILGGAYLIAHLVENITVFENPTSYLYFMFWLAMIYGMTQKAPAAEMVPDKKLSTGLLTGGAIAAVLLIFIFNVQPARANMKALAALQDAGRDPVGAIPAVEEALNFSSPHVDDIRDDVTRAIIQALASMPENSITVDQRQQLFDLVDDALKKNLILHPRDVRIYLTISQLYQTQAAFTNNPALMAKAEQYLKEALHYSPRRQQIMYNLALVEVSLGKNQEAMDLYDQAIKDDPKITETYIRKAYTYKTFLNQPDKAAEVIESAKKNGVVFLPDEQSVIDTFLTSTAATSGAKTSKKK